MLAVLNALKQDRFAVFNTFCTFIHKQASLDELVNKLMLLD